MTGLWKHGRNKRGISYEDRKVEVGFVLPINDASRYEAVLLTFSYTPLALARDEYSYFTS